MIFTILYNILFKIVKIILSSLVLSLHHYNICEKCINDILVFSCSSRTYKWIQNKRKKPIVLYVFKWRNERDILETMMPFIHTDLLYPKNCQVLLSLQNTFQWFFACVIWEKNNKIYACAWVQMLGKKEEYAIFGSWSML